MGWVVLGLVLPAPGFVRFASHWVRTADWVWQVPSSVQQPCLVCSQLDLVRAQLCFGRHLSWVWKVPSSRSVTQVLSKGTTCGPLLQASAWISRGLVGLGGRPDHWPELPRDQMQLIVCHSLKPLVCTRRSGACQTNLSRWPLANLASQLNLGWVKPSGPNFSQA